jgi:hypothetical protein
MLENQGKIIGIEIKNGRSEQTYVKMLHEIERYLIHGISFGPLMPLFDFQTIKREDIVGAFGIYYTYKKL